MLYSLNMTKEPVNPDFSDCPLVIVIFSGVGGGGGGGGGSSGCYFNWILYRTSCK